LEADVSAWKVHYEEANLKIPRLEKELESQEKINRLLSADIEDLSQAAKVLVGQKVVPSKEALSSKIMAE